VWFSLAVYRMLLGLSVRAAAAAAGMLAVTASLCMRRSHAVYHSPSLSVCLSVCLYVSVRVYVP